MVSQKTEIHRRSFDSWRQAGVILPTQLSSGIRALGGAEHRLRLAVLEDAVQQFQRHLNDTSRRGRALYDEVLAWLASENRSEPRGHPRSDLHGTADASAARACGVIDVRAEQEKRHGRAR